MRNNCIKDYIFINIKLVIWYQLHLVKYRLNWCLSCAYKHILIFAWGTCPLSNTYLNFLLRYILNDQFDKEMFIRRSTFSKLSLTFSCQSNCVKVLVNLSDISCIVARSSLIYTLINSFVNLIPHTLNMCNCYNSWQVGALLSTSSQVQGRSYTYLEI